MEAIMRGGEKDGVVIQVGNVNSVSFPIGPPKWMQPDPERPPYLAWGQIVYHRTERLEGERVVFI